MQRTLDMPDTWLDSCILKDEAYQRTINFALKSERSQRKQSNVAFSTTDKEKRDQNASVIFDECEYILQLLFKISRKFPQHQGQPG